MLDGCYTNKPIPVIDIKNTTFTEFICKYYGRRDSNGLLVKLTEEEREKITNFLKKYDFHDMQCSLMVKVIGTDSFKKLSFNIFNKEFKNEELFKKLTEVKKSRST